MYYNMSYLRILYVILSTISEYSQKRRKHNLYRTIINNCFDIVSGDSKTF